MMRNSVVLTFLSADYADLTKRTSTNEGSSKEQSAEICEICGRLFSHRRDHFEFDRDRRGQRSDLDRCARRVWFAGAGEMFGIELVVDREILLHVGEEDRNIDDVIPARAGVFQ